MNEKRHIIKFRHGEREVTVGTDDLRDLSQQTWFSAFLDVPQSSQKTLIEKRPKPKEESEEKENLLKRFEELDGRVVDLMHKNDTLSMENDSLKRQLENTTEFVRVKETEEKLKETLEGASEELAKSSEPEIPKSGSLQSVSSGPGVRPQAMTRQKLPASTFLDIMPEQMTQQVWDTLSPEQQREWMAKHNISQSDGGNV